MGIRKPIRELDSLSSILRTPSPTALARAEYIQQKKAGGCVLCGSRSKLAFYHRNPRTKDFNVQEAGLRVPPKVLEAEIEKCALICFSCRQRILGPYRAPARIKDKELFYGMREAYEAAKTPTLPTRSKNSKKK